MMNSDIARIRVPVPFSKGFSLVELVIALAIFTIAISSVAFFAAESFRASANSRVKIKVAGYTQEVASAIVSMKDTSWGTILAASDGNPKHLVFSDGRYSLAEGAIVIDGITYEIRITDVYRDTQGSVVESGGTLDPHSRLVTTEASWLDSLGETTSLSSVLIINDWNTLTWEETTIQDFSGGTCDSVEIVSIGDGALELTPKLYANWCLPELMITSHDLPGNAVGNVVTADPGHVYIGTGNEFSNPGAMSFMHIITDNEDPPGVDVIGTFSGYAVKDIFGEGDYGYLATTDDNKEVVILDVSSSPFQEIGYFNAPGSGDGESVFVVGNRGYLAQGRELRVFDLTEKTGSRPMLGTIRASPAQLWFMTALVTDVYVVGNYAFCSLHNDWYEMTIIDVSNPSSMTITMKADLNWAQASALFVSPNGNRAYIGTNSSDWGQEFFIINTTNKSNIRTIGSYETNGMSVKGLSVVDERAILVGRNGEEYQVVNVSNEANPSRCGGMQINSGISDVATVNLDGTLFSYILTGDTSAEFKIIRGGLEQGGGDDGRGYVDTGTYISRVFDTERDQACYYYVNWDETLHTGTEVQVQLRSGATPDLSSLPWVGPDGSSGTYFTDPSSGLLPAQLSNNRYIQFRVIMNSDTEHTPLLESIRVTYQ